MQKGDFSEQRRMMVENQLAAKGIRDQRVLEAMLTVPRELFVPESEQKWAYNDGPLSIDYGQTISQPYIVALMSELLALKGDERVLEIGTGSGYQAAILAKLAREVYSIERHEPLKQGAEETLKKLGIEHVEIKLGDGTSGWPEHAPYDGIIVTAGAPDAPQPLLEQLAPEGRLVIPIGSAHQQTLKVIQRKKDKYKKQAVCECRFVPLIGKYGWDD